MQKIKTILYFGVVFAFPTMSLFFPDAYLVFLTCRIEILFFHQFLPPIITTWMLLDSRIFRLFPYIGIL